MHRPPWSYASSITHPSWRWSYQHGKSYARWLHHTPINTRKDYHASTFMIIRIRHTPNHLGVGVINMERATQDDYITRPSIHEKITLHQPSWSKASSITQSSWRWSYQQGKSYTRWLHHTPINTGKDYHASTFMIIRIKHNPTILALFQLHLSSRAQWSLLRIKTALRILINIRRCDQTSRWSLIITADFVPALGSLPTFWSISN